MICPKCGSNHIIITTESKTETKNGKSFDFCWACLGYLIFNIPGLLCGLCGTTPATHTTTTKVVNVCQNCGHRF